MNITSIGSLPGIIKTENEKTFSPTKGFENIFSDFIRNVNNDQAGATKLTQDFVTGGNVELHEVMIAGEKAKTSLELLMEIRNKTLDMYKELTRMQA